MKMKMKWLSKNLRGKNELLFMGTVILLGEVFIIVSFFYLGLSGNWSLSLFMELFHLLVEYNKLDFYIINLIIIAAILLVVNRHSIEGKLFHIMLMVGIVLLSLNIYFFPRNGLSFFNAIFFVYLLKFLRFKRKERFSVNEGTGGSGG